MYINPKPLALLSLPFPNAFRSKKGIDKIGGCKKGVILLSLENKDAK